VSPRDFLQRWGPVTFRLVSVGGPAHLIVPADADRYVLCISWDGTPIIIYPGEQDITTGAIAAGALTRPLIITHAIHGALVNSMWRTTYSGVAMNLFVTEGFQRGT
jgi:hypothetical protein